MGDIYLIVHGIYECSMYMQGENNMSTNTTLLVVLQRMCHQSKALVEIRSAFGDLGAQPLVVI